MEEAKKSENVVFNSYLAQFFPFCRQKYLWNSNDSNKNINSISLWTQKMLRQITTCHLNLYLPKVWELLYAHSSNFTKFSFFYTKINRIDTTLENLWVLTWASVILDGVRRLKRAIFYHKSKFSSIYFEWLFTHFCRRYLPHATN